MKVVFEHTRCEVDGCTKLAALVVFSRLQGKVICVCGEHYSEVIEEKSPEYTVVCPNCGCGIPVN
jgi:hypothetical protein